MKFNNLIVETCFSSGQIIDSAQFLVENASAVKNNKQPAVGISIFTGLKL